MGHVKCFNAYLNIADHNTLFASLSNGNLTSGRALAQRSELQSSGVALVDVPGRSEDVYKILIGAPSIAFPVA